MANDAQKTDVHEVLARHRARYEIRPYYTMLQLFPTGAPAVVKRVQAGFDVDLYGSLLENEHLPIHQIEGARVVLDYFEEVAHDIQSRIGQRCTVEVITYEGSLVLDTKHDFRPEAMLRIRIGHSRGMHEAEGPPEEQALGAIRQVFRELGVREASA
jgi:hypothetical protein